jgi:NAD(P)-dependent dehydrogenase (short-subunit alcohol dehydrogenase family)
LDGLALEAAVKRVVVLGGRGLFGRTIVEQLQRLGIQSLVAGRRPSTDMQIDANDMASITASLRGGDLVIDAAGPFQHRNTALVKCAIELGFNVIDINDNLKYAQQMVALELEIRAAGIRVLSSASSVSAIAATVVGRSGVESPTRVTAFLAPASRHTANAGSAISLIESVGAPIQTFCDGRLQSQLGWSEARRFTMPQPLGQVCGRLFESADSVYLPRIWPSLYEVEMYVDANTLGVNTLLRVAAQFPSLRRLLSRWISLGTRISKMIGSKIGGIGYEIEDATGKIVRFAALSAENSFVIAVAPAVLAARAIVADKFAPAGLVPPHLHAPADELWDFLRRQGIQFVEIKD